MSRLAMWMRRGFYGLLLLSALVLVAATLLPFLTLDSWWVRYAIYPSLQLTLAMAVVGGSLLFWRRRLAWLAVACLLGALAVQASRLDAYVLPPLVGWPNPTVPSGTCAPENRLRLMEVNVQRTNRHDHTLHDMVREFDPDIAWFQEVDAWWANELAALGETMPFSLGDAQKNYFGVHLSSRFPLRDESIQQLAEANNPSVFATVLLPSGRPVRIYAIHPRPPQIGQSTAERDAQLMATALAARGDEAAHLVTGDLNTVPWDDALARLESVGRVADPRIGRGLFTTWNAKRMILKWPLDHVLTGPGIALKALEVLPPFGSDHLPLLADLCVTGGSGMAEPLAPDVLAAARATVARGQGKASQPGAARPEGAQTNEKKD